MQLKQDPMKPTTARDKIIVALDVEELAVAQVLAESLRGAAGAFKIGKQLFTRYGPEAAAVIRKSGGRFFLDLKFHDIPNTVAGASREAVRLGAAMFTIHAMGGYDMIRQAVAAVHETTAATGCERPAVLAVTVLTSLGPDDMQRIGLSGDLEEMVVRLARLAQKAGADGVVASPREIAAVKDRCGSDFLVVTPGIRPAEARPDDQKRAMTPVEAVRAGADYLVVGRPVTRAPDPRAALESIVRDLEG